MGSLKDLPDINVWVALSSPEHVHHKRADDYYRSESNRTIAFCAQTAIGLVRILSNPHAIGGKPLSVSDAWTMYLSWRRQREVSYLHEPRGHEIVLARYVANNLVNRRTWSDGQLAAVAQSAMVRLVTFDSDFNRFEGLSFLHLSS